MDKLPFEMMTHLLSYLDLGSLLRLRAANKHFYSVVRSYRLASLSVSENEVDNLDNFFYTHEPIKASQSFVTSNSNFFRSSIMKRLLERIKRLQVDVFPSEKAKSPTFNVNLNLNHLKSLEVLQIKKLKCRRDGHLSLPNLLVLNIEDCTGDLKLETPRLFAFKSNSQTECYFEFEFPEKITHLGMKSLTYYHWRHKNPVGMFENLQYLYLKDGILPEEMDLNDSNLKEVHFYQMDQTLLHSLLTNGGIAAKKINFFLNGIQVKEPDEVADLFTTEPETSSITHQTRMFAIYYGRLSDRLPWVKEIDYSALVGMFNEIPPDFHERFFQISSVHVNQPADQAKLVAFLTKCRAVRVLNLKNVSFDRSFFDNIRDYCPYLQELSISEHKETINLAFVSRQESLESLSIDQEVSFYKMNQILSHFSLDDENRTCQLKYFSFKFRNKTCIVQCERGFRVDLDGQVARFYDRKAMFNVLRIVSKCK